MSNRVRFALIISLSLLLVFGLLSLITGNPKFFLFALFPAFLSVSSTWGAERRKV